MMKSSYGMSSCYYSSGIQANSNMAKTALRNCPEDPVTGLCCSLASIEVDGARNETCLNNGLCLNEYTSNHTLHREFYTSLCTEKDWTTGNCLDICKDQRDGNGTARVTPCYGETGTTWCCGDKDDCCYNGGVQQVTLSTEFRVKLPPSTLSLSSSSSSIYGSGSWQTDSSSPGIIYRETSTGLSPGQAAGIGVGVGVFILVLAACVVLLMRRARARKEARNLEGRGSASGVISEPAVVCEASEDKALMELPSDRGRVELPFRREAAELSSENRYSPPMFHGAAPVHPHTAL
ncbi:unnamed protein product [Periconia digitata]|uniref:Uncharacterized protein n=1 Tax=Periconia digitata TaxID=1303443 RepID=A0A9W4UAT6_9PLEO|nr:unnamed protein product [Periconia digitata]